MKKDAYYFPHFCNARHDRKLKRVRKDLGMEGYGIFFMLLEVLREQTDFTYPLGDTDLLADEFGTSVAKIEAVINAYNLFNIDAENNFFSSNLVFYLQPYLNMKEQRRLAGIKSGEVRKIKAKNKESNEQPLSDRSATVERSLNENEQSKVKESKVKESKVKDSKKHYAEFVSLTENEYNTLLEKHGLAKLNKLISTLDNYKGANNKKYASDYRAILTWVVDRVSKEDIILKTESKGWESQKKW